MHGVIFCQPCIETPSNKPMEVTFAFQSHKGLSKDFSFLHSQVGGLNNPERKGLTLQGILAAPK